MLRMTFSSPCSPLIWQQALYQAQLVRIFLPVAVENAVVVERVETHLAVGVQNLALVQHHAHVHDTALGVVEKR